LREKRHSDTVGGEMRKYLEALASAVARRLTNRKGVAVSSFLVFSLLFLTGSPVLSASSASRARAVSAAPLALASGPVGRIGTETRGETENPEKTPPKSLASPGSPNAKAGVAPQIAVAAAIGGADLGGDVASEGRVDRGLCFAAYKVKKGDTLSGIADSFNISLDTVVSFNRIKNARALQPGKILKIPSMSGILYVAKAGDSAAKVAAANGISGDRVIEANALESDQLEPGRSVFLPDAKLASFTLREISGDLFAWPARGWITSWYGWRSDPFTGDRKSVV
jgi:LysM repeat protein